MKLNKFMFSEEFAYTYQEVLVNGLSLSAVFSGSSQVCELLIYLQLALLSDSKIIDAGYGHSFVHYGENADNAIDERVVHLLNKIQARYGEHYALVIADQTELENASKSFFKKICNVLDYTYDKYNTLLSIYAEQKSHLLDKLERTRNEDKSTESEVSSTSSSNSKSASSDTPQTINVSQNYGEIAGYFNNFDQAGDEAESHSEGANEETNEITETFDPTTLMARIEEIQTKYENTMFKWVEEFDRLFIEEGNI